MDEPGSHSYHIKYMVAANTTAVVVCKTLPINP